MKKESAPPSQLHSPDCRYDRNCNICEKILCNNTKYIIFLQAGGARQETPVEELQQPLPEEFPHAGPPQEQPAGRQEGIFGGNQEPQVCSIFLVEKNFEKYFLVFNFIINYIFNIKMIIIR